MELFQCFASGFAGWRIQDVNHQAQRQYAVQKESDGGTQKGALCAEGFGQRHHQNHIKPGDHDQVHVFSLQIFNAL